MTEYRENHEAPGNDESSGFIEDVQVDWKEYSIEDYVSFVIFWVLGAVVFAQFFSRYVLNDSIAWTEEIARYLLIAVAFAGAPIAVRKNTHIHVEFFYRFINRSLARFLSVLVDLIRIVFFAYASWLSWKIIKIMKLQYMVALNISMAWIYGLVFAGFLLMTFRAVQVAVTHWRRGYSCLDYRPEENALS
ncbi:MAG: TRAP transporter small permease [Desulfofustis sp.]|jgi:TRAP-type C4-dicarboxylate transport system permease small subunit|nr:TRAP transporter small permease [Desulfofustis sp.]